MSRRSACLLSLLLAAPAGALETMFVTVPQAAGLPSKSIEVAKGFALVRWSSAAASGFPAAVAAAGARLVGDLGSGWSAVELPPGMEAPQGIAWLKSLPGALAVQFDNIYRLNRTPNDPLFASQYGLDQINAKAAWDYEVGASSRVTIAIVDSGIEGAHPDLSGKLTSTTSRRFATGSGTMFADNPPTSECNHATRVAGIAAATTDNGAAVAGVSWNAQLVSFKVFNPSSCNPDCSGAGCVTDDAAIVAAINQAVAVHNTAAYGRMVVNMSLGGANSCTQFGTTLRDAVSAAVAAGVVLVAASGNDGGAVNSPGNCSGVIPVGATDSAGNIASFSSRGPELAAGGLVAPGVSVLSTDVGGGTVSGISGTSFSAPHVSGAAALILAAKPTYTVAQVLSTLRNSSDPVGFGTAAEGFKTAGNSSGAGRLNAFLAVRLAVTGQLADFQGEDKVVAFPNPFRADRHANVTFAFPASLQSSTDVTIKIYTMDGALVRDLNSLTWNARNEQGKPVASGTYVYVVSTSRGKKTGRVSVLR